MRVIVRTAFLFVTACSIAAFAQTTPTPEPIQTAVTAATPVFDCYHINFAWGFSLAGRFIDSDGTIYSYRKTHQAWLPHEVVENGARYLSEADFQAKYAEREKSGSVEALVLRDKSALIEAAAKGKIVHEDGGARDAGSSSCHAYVRDAAHGRYRDVELGSDGGINDSRTKNDSAQAQDLLGWLRSVGVAH